MEVLIDKHGADVEEVDTFLHEAQSPEEIAAMLKSPLIDVNVTNKVRSLLLAIDITHTCCSPAPATPPRN